MSGAHQGPPPREGTPHRVPPGEASSRRWPSEGPETTRASSALRRALSPVAPVAREQGQRPGVPAEPPQLRPTGLGLAPKFTLFIALAVAITSSIQAVVAYVQTSQEMDDRINEAGIQLVKAISSIDWSYWENFFQRPLLKTLSETKKTVNEILQQAYDRKAPKGPDGDSTGAEEVALRLGKAFETMEREVERAFPVDRSDGRSPLHALSKMAGAEAKKLGLHSPEIVNLIIVRDQQIVAGIEQTAIRLGDKVLLGSVGDVKIEEGYYQGRGRTRSFSKPIYQKSAAPEGGDPWSGAEGPLEQVAQVVLYLSAVKIDEAQARLFLQLLLPWLLSVGIGALLGWFLAGKVTHPVQALVEDMVAVSQGDLEHQTVPRSSDEIGLLARAFNRMTRGLKDAHVSELEQRAFDHELSIATEIQSNLLPKKIPKIARYDISAYYRPSKEVGGDYYDFITIGEQQLGIVVADVSGKGIPGSMVMAMARSLIRMEAVRNPSAADTMVKVNRILARDMRRGMFVTCLYAVLDVAKHQLVVSSAGHNPLVVIRQAKRAHELVNPNGIALGFDAGPLFERSMKEAKVDLAPGDRVVLYTDGCIEAMNIRDQEFGEERFYQLAVQLTDRPSTEFINLMVKVIDEHKGSAAQHDDMTVVTFRYGDPSAGRAPG